MDNDLILKVLLAIGQTFAYFAVGFLALKMNYLDKKEVERFGSFVMDILFPFCSFACIVTGMRQASMTELCLPPLIGIGIMAFHALCGLLLQFGLRDKAVSRRKAFRQFSAVNNYLFLPIILIEGIYGSRGVSTLMLIYIGSTIGFWSIGILVMAENFSPLELLKKLCQPNLIVIALGIVLVRFDIPVPESVIKICNGIGSLGAPLMLLLTGASLGCTGVKLFTAPADAAWGVLCRLVIIPALSLLVLFFLPLEPMLRNVTFILVLMPSSCASVLLIRKYQGDGDFAGQILLFSTLLSPLTLIGFFYAAQLIHMV